MSEKFDLIATARAGTAAFGRRALEWATSNWLKGIVLIASATQTYALIDFIAPEWAFWLPAIAVLLMEGTVPLWQIREENADAADGKVSDKEKNEQERIANSMVWVSIIMSAITMVGGALVEVSEGALADVLKPNAGITAFVGWVAIIGVFLLGTTHLISDWKYRRADPLVALQREFRAKTRELLRKRKSVELTGQRRIMESELRKSRRLYNQHAKKLGEQQAQDRFEEKTGKEKQK